MDRAAHWQRVYTTKQPDEVSWYQATPVHSLALLRDAGAGPERSIIDVGGGDSTLVDAVLGEPLGHITVLDISEAALARARERLGARAADATWICADVTHAALPEGAFDVWHDRAVYHFLVDAADRARYADAAARAVKRGGSLILATFAANGPTRCSGLDVCRYSAGQLAAALGACFELERSFEDTHHTPSGGEQRFLYAVFRRR